MAEERPTSRVSQPQPEAGTREGLASPSPSDSLENIEKHALLDGMAPGGSGRFDAGWARHDFRPQPGNLASAEISRLEESHQRFAGRASSKLGLLLRQKVQVESPVVRVSTYAEFTRGLPEPTSLYLVHSGTLGAQFLMAVSSRTLLSMIERLLGAPPGTDPTPERALTSLEESLARTVLRRILEALDSAWSTADPLALEVLDTEHSPHLLQVQEPEAAVVRVTASVTVDDREDSRGDLEIVVPHGPLLSYLSGPAGGRFGPEQAGPSEGPNAEAAPEFAGGILALLEALKVEVTADLTTKPLPLHALLGLQPGDFVDTGVRVDEAIDLRIAGSSVAPGTAGDAGGRLGLRIG